LTALLDRRTIAVDHPYAIRVIVLLARALFAGFFLDTSPTAADAKQAAE
jgi:hypothetical protein